MKITGKSVSKGIIIGNTYILKLQNQEIIKENIINVEEEIKKLNFIKEAAIKELDDLYNFSKKEVGDNEAQIFIGHKLLLEDNELLDRVKEIVINEKVNIKWAIKKTEEEFVSIFRNMKNVYMRERATDIIDICNRLINILDGQIDNNVLSGIIVANELTPSQTIKFDKRHVKGIITEKGGINSHVAIIARMLEIPAITNVKNALNLFNDGDEVVIDANSSIIILNPDEKCIKHYRNLKNNFDLEKESLKEYIGKNDETNDGYKVKVLSNIANINDLKMALENDAKGIGLFRTEFMYMNRTSFPTEDEHYSSYKYIAENIEGPIIIRTLDIGGDKKVDYIGIEKEENPFLGYRAIRYCLDNEEVFVTQIKGILRASYNTNIKIMFPMISSLEELERAKVILEKAKELLIKEEKLFNKDIEVGMMIETPAAAILSDIFAKEVDFFSIGTNDLIQYTVAVDRTNDKVENLYSPHNLSILRLIKNTIDNGHKENIMVGMCGEVASDSKIIPLLIGMGIDEISVNPSKILNIRKTIANVNKEKSINLYAQVEQCKTVEKIKKLLEY